MESLSIIIPAYNEEDKIKENLKSCVNFFSENYEKDFEFIVITDGCTDKTPELVESLANEYPSIRHIHPKDRLGKGGAVIKGFKMAEGEFIGFMDADNPIGLEEVKAMIKELERYDGVISSRYIDGAEVVPERPFSRHIASRGFNLLVKLFFGLDFKDTQCGAKFFRREAIEEVIDEIVLESWAFDVDLLYNLCKSGYEIKEFPVTWVRGEDSKLNIPKASLKMFLALLKLKLNDLI